MSLTIYLNLNPRSLLNGTSSRPRYSGPRYSVTRVDGKDTKLL